MKYSEIVRKIGNNLFYLENHNKNLTKEQAAAIQELRDLTHDLFVMIQQKNIKF